MSLFHWLWAPWSHEQATRPYEATSALCTPDRHCLTGSYQEDVPQPTHINPSIQPVSLDEVLPTYHARNYGKAGWRPNKATLTLMEQLMQEEDIEVVTTPPFKGNR